MYKHNIQELMHIYNYNYIYMHYMLYLFLPFRLVWLDVKEIGIFGSGLGSQEARGSLV